MWEISEKRGSEGKELRSVFVETLEELMEHNPKVMALEADLGTASGFSRIKKSHPKQFVEVGIAEANMIGVAAGLSMRGFTPFVHTFSPFASRRVADQVFLEGAYAHNTIHIYGSDPGVCAAANGGTHTAFEDVAFYRALPEAEVFDPADEVQLRWLIKELENHKGVHYIRANRKAVPRIYAETSSFEIGRGNVLHKGTDVLVVTAGILICDALDAAEELERQGISVEVIDLFTIKPLDRELILKEAAGKKLVVTFENHSIYNGIGSAVAEVLSEAGMGVVLRRIGVEDKFGQVGSMDYLKNVFGLTKEHLMEVIVGVQSQGRIYGDEI